jgi:large subunit ribosomal protein L19
MRRSAIEFIESKQVRKDVTAFRTGDTVRVHWKIKEGEKERVQPFEGVVIRKTKGYNRATFTVRKVSYGVGVERIFPLHSPRYERIEVLSRGDVNRNRLFYLRNLRGKASRVDVQDDSQDAPGAAQAPAAAAATNTEATASGEGQTEAKPTAKSGGKKKAAKAASAEKA